MSTEVVWDIPEPIATLDVPVDDDNYHHPASAMEILMGRGLS